MRYAAGHREQTRAKILRAACRVFRRQGYHAAGVDKVMEEAGLTAGGFYAHFASKEAL
ncbi:MAG: helix-turn-helix domain-containing protein, partial [Isosphaeraceae bacterium]